MLGVLCVRPPKPWILNSLSLIAHGGSAAHHQDSRLVHWPTHFADLSSDNRRCRHHSTACRLGGSDGGAASIWHAILPCGGGEGGRRRGEVWKNVERKGEGSWNVAWDARPARWLHRSDSAWLLFGVCACMAPMIEVDVVTPADDQIEAANINLINLFNSDEKSSSISCSASTAADSYKVTG